MSVVKKYGGWELMVYRLIAVFCFAVLIDIFVDSLAHRIPITEIFANQTSMLIIFAAFFLMYGVHEFSNYRKQKELQSRNMQDEDAIGNNTVSCQQMRYKDMSSSDKLSFWFGVCCGIATTLVLLWLLYDRALRGIIFS